MLKNKNRKKKMKTKKENKKTQNQVLFPLSLNHKKFVKLLVTIYQLLAVIAY